MSDLLTPSQTVGPFLSIGLTWSGGHLVVPEGSPGAIRISGVVRDGAGAPVPDGVIETWQADPDGRFDHPDDPRGRVARTDGFRAFGRCATDAEGRWEVTTLKPGRVPTTGGALAAPHVDLSVFARGLLDRVVTRLYFSDEAEPNAADPVLAGLPPERRQTLVAEASGDNYRLDIRLQGEHETVFFAG
jgi:protocatechuate 3,4-dioxygenase alpha subunit